MPIKIEYEKLARIEDIFNACLHLYSFMLKTQHYEAAQGYYNACVQAWLLCKNGETLSSLSEVGIAEAYLSKPIAAEQNVKTDGD